MGPECDVQYSMGFSAGLAIGKSPDWTKVKDALPECDEPVDGNEWISEYVAVKLGGNPRFRDSWYRARFTKSMLSDGTDVLFSWQVDGNTDSYPDVTEWREIEL